MILVNMSINVLEKIVLRQYSTFDQMLCPRKDNPRVPLSRLVLPLILGDSAKRRFEGSAHERRLR